MPVYALVAGVGDFPEAVEDEEDQAEGVSALLSLESVCPAVQAVASALHRAEVLTGGDPLIDPDQTAFLERWHGLRSDTAHEDPLIVHFVGHGVRGRNGGLYLACAGASARPEELDDFCLSFDQLLATAENGMRPILFLLDVCGAGQAVLQQQLQDLAARRSQTSYRNAWIIGACSSDTATYGSYFTSAVTTILHQLTDGTLDVTPTLRHVPVDTLAAAIGRELARTNRAAGRPSQAVVRTPHLEASVDPQPFLRNPGYTDGSHRAVLEGMDPRLREFAHACSPGLDPLHLVTRAAGNPSADVIQFSGRAAALRRITTWISQLPNAPGASTEKGGGGSAEEGRLLVVTGGPGTGKSALLGLTACLTHPELTPLRPRIRNAVRAFRPCPSGRVLAVHARQLTLQQTVDSLLHQLRSDSLSPENLEPSSGFDSAPGSLEDLLSRLSGEREFTLILDALDEALNPAELLDRLLLPLLTPQSAGGAGIRIMIGTRPWWDSLPSLHEHLRAHPADELCLDPVTEQDRFDLADDLHTYLDLVLDTRFPPDRLYEMAQQLARYTDSGAFLVAALYANHLISSTSDDVELPPRSITEVFDLQRAALARTDPWIVPVMAVLGHARGQGMPLHLIHAAALAHLHASQPSQPTPQLGDTQRALTKAAFYLRTTPDAEHRLVYRYFHQALTDHTKPDADPFTVNAALLSTVPATPDGHRDWENANPYLRLYAAAHAADAHAIDALLQDAAYLVFAEPDLLAAHLHRVTTEQGVLTAHIYRTTTTHHSGRHRAVVRRDLLTTDAASWQQHSLADVLATVTIDGLASTATPRWGTRLSAHPSRLHTLTEHTGPVLTAVTAHLRDGTPVAITAGRDQMVRVWNFATGQLVYRLSGHTGTISTVAITTLSDGTPVAITGGQDPRVRVWHLDTGQLGHIFDGHTRTVRAVATVAASDGTPLAVTASSDHTAVIWNLATGELVHRLAGHAGPVLAVATANLPDGTPLAITTSSDRTLIIWGLEPGGPPVFPVFRTRITHTCPMVSVVATMLPDRTPVAITLDEEGNAQMWNLLRGTRVGSFGADPTLTVVTGTFPDGQPLAVTTKGNGTAQVWSLGTHSPLHHLTGHTGPVLAAATATLPDDTLLAVTTGSDGAAIVWDLTSVQSRRPLTGHSDSVCAVSTAGLPPDSPLAMTMGRDRSLIVWDVTAEKAPGPYQRPLSGVLAATTAGLSDGIPLVVALGEDGHARVQNLVTGYIHTIHDRSRSAVAAAIVTSRRGTPMVITVGFDFVVSNLLTGKTVHRIPGPNGAMMAVAATNLPGGQAVAITTGHDGMAVVWDIAKGQPLHLLSKRIRSSTAVTTSAQSDGTPLLVALCADRRVRVWDLVTGQPCHTLHQHSDSVVAVATSSFPDGTPVAVTASRSGTIAVWNLATGEPCHRLRAHTGPINAVATTVRPDGTALALATGHDATVSVWDVATGNRVLRCQLPAAGRVVAFTATGFLVGHGPDVTCFAWTDAGR